VLQSLAQGCAHGAAPDTERVGDFLLRETEVVVRDDHRPLTTCQETEQLAGLESVQQLVGLRWDRRLAKGADELVKPERKPETAEPPRSPERDPEQPARECVIAFRRTPHPFRERFLQRVLRKLGVEEDSDERAVDAWI